MRARTLIAFGLALAGGAGCMIDGSSHHERQPPPFATTQPTPTSTPSAPTSPPPKIAIDSGQNLTSEPGAGAGVFVSYAGAGQWSIAWTCDTNTSGIPCDFEIVVDSKGITQLDPTSGAKPASASPTELSFATSTGSTLERISFVAEFGASIVLNVKIDGRPQPNLVFYVSNGRILSAPTNPIELVPVTP
jgi:Tfp pilus assembly protein PilW